MFRNLTLRNWTILAALSFGLGGEVLLWLFMGGSPHQGLWLSLPVVLAYAATGALTWWYLIRRGFEFSVWRGIVIGLIVGLLAPSVFWLFSTTFYFLVGKEFPVFDRVINPFEALRLLPQVTLVSWETLGWGSAAMCALVSGVLAFLKVRTLPRTPDHHSFYAYFECCRHTAGDHRVIYVGAGFYSNFYDGIGSTT